MPFFILLSLFFSACSSLTVYQPTAILEIPEVTESPFAGSFDVGTVPTIEYTGTSDPSARPFSFDSQAKNGNAQFIRTRAPYPDRSIEFAGGIYTVGSFFGSFKYQFLGGHFPRQKAGDYSLAFVTQASMSLTSRRSGSGIGESSGGFPWDAKASTSQAGLSFLGGWRPSDNILIYGGPYFSYTSIVVDVHQSPATDGSSPGSDANLNDRILRYGPTFGVLISSTENFSVHMEGHYLLTTFGQPIKLNPVSGAAIILRYDKFLDQPPEQPYVPRTLNE